MNVILNVFPNSMKIKVGQCSTAKALWEKLHNLYSTKKSGQYVIKNLDPSDYDEEMGEISKKEFQNQVIKVTKELRSPKGKDNTFGSRTEGSKITHQRKLRV